MNLLIASESVKSFLDSTPSTIKNSDTLLNCFKLHMGELETHRVYVLNN
jgi:hypothetical protein